MPYNYEVIELIKKFKKYGHKIILITASPQIIAEKVSEFLQLFDEAIGCNESSNLKGEKKSLYLSKRYGDKGFHYIGNSYDDIPVWKSADQAILVSNNSSLEKKLKSINPNSQIISEKFGKISLFSKQFRLHQWTKNLLLFLPILMAHQLLDFDKFIQLLIGFFIFSLTASGIYTINDLFDLESDRSHSQKRNRPLASGKFPIQLGIILPPILILFSQTFAFFFLPYKFFLVLLLYFILTTAYSFYLKRIIILDILILASLYSIRIIAGGYIVDIYLSPWLLTFSMFIFLSLAIAKRYIELHNLKLNNNYSPAGRGYRTGDIDLLRGLGTASGYISVMVFALYINSKDIVSLYTNPMLLWAVVPLLLFWITRIWFLAARGEFDEDPLVFTIKDKISYIIGLLIVLVVIGASL